MALNILTLILLVTVLVSALCFNNRELFYRFAFVPGDIKQGKKRLGFLTHMLVHADWAHLMFNMFSLYFLGDALLSIQGHSVYRISDGLIATYGPLRGNLHFLLIYVLGGVASTFWPLWRNQDNPSYVSVGASGAVSAIIFATILWNPFLELEFIFLPGIGIPSYIFGPLFLAFEFWAFKRNKTNIAHDAHIGGALFGLLYVMIINPDKLTNLFSQIFA